MMIHLQMLEGHFRKKFFLIAATLLVAVLVAAAVFYFRADRPLGDLYARKIGRIALLQTTTLKESLVIFISFACVAALSIAASVILFTHRVAGPLISARHFLRKSGDGDPEAFLKFREKDAVKPLADAMNLMHSRFRERHTRIEEAVETLEKDIGEIRRLIEQGEIGAAEERRKEALSRASEINAMLSEIRT